MHSKEPVATKEAKSTNQPLLTKEAMPHLRA